MSGPGPTRLSPATPAGFAELLMRGWIARARARAIHGPRDLGASVIEWVIISAIVVVIAIAVGGILMNTISNKANSINLDTSKVGGP
jgi:hypothetical protein